LRLRVVLTLGKALGVNGGYVTGSRVLTEYLRETAPTYIYSNPITVGECAAALRARRARSSALRATCSIARASSSVSPGFTRIAASPAISRSAVQSEAIVGAPNSMPSSTGSPKPSKWDV